MSSILSTQKRHSFLRRKYCFFPAMALSPPVGLEEPLMGLPPLCSAMMSSYDSLLDTGVSATATLAPGRPGATAAGSLGSAGAAGALGTAMGGGAGRRAARF